MKNILVPIDFSDISTDLLEQAVEIGKKFDSDVYLVHVTQPDSVPANNKMHPENVTLPHEWDELSEQEEMKAMLDYVKQHNIRAKAAIKHGPVVATILAEAEDFNADLIIVGASSSGFLYRKFIGTVSDGIIRNSECPVLVVPQL